VEKKVTSIDYFTISNWAMHGKDGSKGGKRINNFQSGPCIFWSNVKGFKKYLRKIKRDEEQNNVACDRIEMEFMIFCIKRKFLEVV